MTERAGMVPYFGYEDPNAALDFLERAFGFETSARYDGDDGTVMHAEMQFGGGVIMLGKGTDQQRTTTRDLPPATRGVYCVVDDVDSHFAKAKEAGATVVYGPEDTEFGTRRYRVMDPEGYEWSFGTYKPQVK